MKTYIKAFSFVVMCSIVANGDCAESYRVHGEVYVVDGQDKSTRAIPSDVVSGVPLILNDGEKSFSLVFVFEPPPSVKYSLTVSLLANPKSVDGFSTTLVSDTFQSSLVGGNKGPLEFKMEQNGIKVGGIVGISSIH